MSETSQNEGIKTNIQFIGNGKKRDFHFSFPIFDAADIEVYFGDEPQHNGFNVIKAINTEGGEVLFDTAPQNGTTITLNRNLTIKRTSDFSETASFSSKVLNHEFDYQVACLEQLSNKIDRGLSVPVYDTHSINLNLPSPKAGKALIWNENEDSLINSQVDMKNLDSIIDEAIKAKQYADSAMSSAENAETCANSIETKIDEINTVIASIDNGEGKANKDLSNVTSSTIYTNCFIAPKPNTSSGVGQFIKIDNTQTISTFTLPAGGSWLCNFCGRRTTDLAGSFWIINNGVGIFAGGTIINTVGSAGSALYGTAWRIA